MGHSLKHILDLVRLQRRIKRILDSEQVLVELDDLLAGISGVKAPAELCRAWTSSPERHQIIEAVDPDLEMEDEQTNIPEVFKVFGQGYEGVDGGLGQGRTCWLPQRG